MKKFVEFYNRDNQQTVHVDMEMVYMVGEPWEIDSLDGKRSKKYRRIYLDTSNYNSSILVEDTVEEIMEFMNMKCDGDTEEGEILAEEV